MNAEEPSRRVVLRGAMAAGCGLWVPIILPGCNAKSGAGSNSAAPPAPVANPQTPAVEAATPKKLSQAIVQYQSQPKGEQKCASCVNFIAQSNACKLVDGQISPSAWCTLWVKKA